MKAFWWFKENSVAGMARPGFNGIHWFDLPFEEALIFGWVGQRSCDRHSLDSLKTHIREYGSKIYRYFNMDEASFLDAAERLENHQRMAEVLNTVANKTKAIGTFEIDNETIDLKLCQSRLQWEIDFLKKQNVRRIVSLTENHHQKEVLKNHFDLHHLAIDDLNPPSLDQAQELAAVLQGAKDNQERVVVHCMAGIGRTTTMLMASHLLLGESLSDLKACVEKQNPSFHFSGPQWNFIQSVAATL